jgi:hypothetical protein
MRTSKFLKKHAYMRDNLFINKRENDEKQKEAYLKLYRGVLAQVPNFKKTLEEFGDDFESIMDLIGVVSLNYPTILF